MPKMISSPFRGFRSCSGECCATHRALRRTVSPLIGEYLATQVF
jgi:hypothetical protein